MAVQLRGVTPNWQKDTLGDDPAAELRQSLQNALTEWRRPGAVQTASPMVPGMRIIDLAPADAVHAGPGYSAWPGRPAERGSCRPSSMASGHRGPPRRDAASERSVLVSTWPTTPPCLIGSSGCLAALPPEVARSAWSCTAGRSFRAALAPPRDPRSVESGGECRGVLQPPAHRRVVRSKRVHLGCLRWRPFRQIDGVAEVGREPKS